MANRLFGDYGAGVLIVPASNGAARTIVNEIPFLLFDASSDEYVYTPGFLRVPTDYGLGTLKADLLCSGSDSATSGVCVWDVYVEKLDLTAAWPTDITGKDSANSGNFTASSPAKNPGVVTITLSNDDSIADGDYVRFIVMRDADNGSDTLAEDARLHHVYIYEEIT